MKIMVTGAAGFIGSALSQQLLLDGHEVIGVDCLLPDLYPAQNKLDNIKLLVENHNFKFVEKNLAIDDLRTELEDVEVVINEAAIPGLKYSWSNFKSYSTNNIVSVANLLTMLSDFPSIYLVHASSSSVYGGYIEGDERQSLAPVSPYGVSKLAAEKIIDVFASQRGCRYSILRYFSVYGPRQRPDMAYSKICRSLLNNDPISIYGDGSQTRNNTYISDVVEATILAATLKPVNVTMNICGSEEVSLLEAIEILANNLEAHPQLVFYPKATGDQARTHGTSTLAFETFGWTPKVGIKQGLFNQAQGALEGIVS